jgi:hypothetical protein
MTVQSSKFKVQGSRLALGDRLSLEPEERKTKNQKRETVYKCGQEGANKG